jgi:hypothetical protein
LADFSNTLFQQRLQRQQRPFLVRVRSKLLLNGIFLNGLPPAGPPGPSISDATDPSDQWSIGSSPARALQRTTNVGLCPTTFTNLMTGTLRPRQLHQRSKAFCNSQAVQKLKKQVKTKSSFLKKRTKKLLLRDAKAVPRPLAKNY